MLPEVSVITVCYNPLRGGRRELFLKNLESVQAQQGVALEHLIIDGASDDGTVDWLRTFHAGNHPMVIASEPDGGIYDAMNKGIRKARGKYILFLNTDDYFHSADGMQQSVTQLERTGCDFSFAPVRFSDARIHHHIQQAPQRRLHHFIISWSFSHQTMLTRRDRMRELGGFDLSYRSAADYDLLLRLIMAGGKGCFVPHVFTTFNTEGFSAENRDLAIQECVRTLQAFFLRFYHVEMTPAQVRRIQEDKVYPRRYLQVYCQTQRLVDERFLAVPHDPISWISRKFNIIKYYIKCLLNTSNA